MTATVTSTQKEADRRILPGDGKLNPVNHIVRIVVVGPRSDSNDALPSDGPGQSHGLTKDELKAAEDELKNKPAPPSSGGTPGGEDSSPNMFEALEPTDIVVVGRQPASVRKVDSSGKPVSANRTSQTGQTASEPKPTRKLFAHDHHQTETVLRVWTESDTIEYRCDRPFKIVEVKRTGWKVYDTPDNPFGIGKEKENHTTQEKSVQVHYTAEKKKVETGEELFVWTSGFLPSRANNQQYKMSFEIFDENGKNGKLVDPDIVCGNPPPNP